MRTFGGASKEAYQLLLSADGREYEFYITDRGRIIRIPARLKEKERRQALLDKANEYPLREKRINEKPGMMLMVDIGHKHMVLKTLVVRAFSDAGREVAIRSHHQIQHINGDAKDCSLKNLVLYSEEEAQDLGLYHKWKIEVTYRDGRIISYPSLGACAASIPCDRHTLYDYLHGISKNSCVSQDILLIRQIKE